MDLQHLVDFKPFRQTLKGYNRIMEGYNDIDIKRKNIVTLIDFTKPSTEERFYVLDLKQKKLLFRTHVSHGRNSGDNYATSFSNKNESNQSSLGFFLTETKYVGKNGNSLLLDGLEKDINHLAKRRAIVIHGAPYSDPSILEYSNRLGRSLGCPALPPAVSDSIINTIMGGSLIFIYANRQEYVDKSDIIIENPVVGEEYY